MTEIFKVHFVIALVSQSRETRLPIAQVLTDSNILRIRLRVA
jgi:hypothetical protein